MTRNTVGTVVGVVLVLIAVALAAYDIRAHLMAKRVAENAALLEQILARQGTVFSRVSVHPLRGKGFIVLRGTVKTQKNLELLLGVVDNAGIPVGVNVTVDDSSGCSGSLP